MTIHIVQILEKTFHSFSSTRSRCVLGDKTGKSRMYVLLTLALFFTGSRGFSLQPLVMPIKKTGTANMARQSLCIVMRMGEIDVDRRTLLIGSGAFASASLPTSVSAQNDKVVQQKADSASWAVHQGPFSDKEFSDFMTTESGLKYKDIVVGTGATPTKEDTVRLHYAGYLLNGQQFDTSYREALFPFSLFIDGAPPIAFKLAGGLLPGFIEGVLGMNVGGKRICLLKPSLAYGSVGVSGVIPPDSPLVFYLELKSIGSGISL